MPTWASCPSASLVAAAVLLAASTAAAEMLVVPRTDAPPVVNGELDDPAWVGALVLSNFAQQRPVEGAPPSEATEVSLVYTPDSLYLAVRAHDRHPERIVATAMRRDDWLANDENDQFAFAIDSYGDGRNGYWFSTNPLGVRVDARFFDEGRLYVTEWDGNWDCASRTGADGWTSEIRIPFTTLRFESSDRNVMGIYLFRRIIRTDEQLYAPPLPLDLANGTANVSRATRLVLEGIFPGRHLALRPHLTARRNRTPGDASGDAWDAGGDLGYGLSPSLDLLVTVNTDFALGDVDDRQLNLGRAQEFVPERRDFFVDQAGSLAFGIPERIQLSHTRRIGLPSGPADGTASQPLRVGASLAGQLGDVELGLLHARTGSSRGRGGEDFLVGRAKLGLGRRSYAGAIVTHRRGGPGDADNSAVGADALVMLDRLGVSGFVAATRDSSDAGSVTDSAWSAAVFRDGERDAFRIELSQVGEQFDPGVGFLDRAGLRRLAGEFRLPRYLDGSRLRRGLLGYQGQLAWREDGRFDSWEHSLAFDLDWRSEDRLSTRVAWRYDGVATPFSVLPGKQVGAGDYHTAEWGARYDSKPGRSLAGSLLLSRGGFFGGTRTRLTGSLRWAADRHLTTILEYEASWASLPSSRFRADVVQARVELQLDRHMSGIAVLQFDDETSRLALTGRLRYVFREGTELAALYSEGADRLPGSPRHSGLFGPGTDRSIVLTFTALLDL